MTARGMAFGWRRVPAAAPAGPAVVALAATLVGAATAAMAQLNAVAGTGEQAETTALVGRMSVAPSGGRRALIDTAIAGLKADGVWAKLDWLVVTAAHDAQAARLNWRAAKALAAVNSPVFTVDRGYAGDGASAYLDAGETPQAAGNGFAQTSAAIGVWQNTASGTMNYQIGLVSGGNLRVGVTSTSFTSRLNSSGNAAGSGLPASASRHVAVTRTGSTVSALIDGAPGVTVTSAATTLAASNLALLLSSGAYSSLRVAAAWSGTYLTDAEIAALHGRLNTFLTAIGGQ